jgi:sec-independent protein translocase protein TatB
MFDLAWSEMILIAVVALIVIGPKELPDVLRNLGQWVAKARGYAREFQNHFDDLVREADVKKMREDWNNNILEKERMGLEADLMGNVHPPESAPPETPTESVPHQTPNADPDLAQAKP